MSYAVMKIGDSGADVRTLKTLLRGAGYSVEDGDVFDEETKSVIKSYQKANGLEETGEAGAGTWARLASSVVVSMPKEMNTKESVEYLEKNYPKPYASDYSAQIDGLLQQVLNREAFSYDPAEDPMYQKYKDQYTYLGKKAMNDAIGQASALSGGYANSYAETVGQQAYQDYMASLTDAIPDMYNLALSAYDSNTEQMLSKLAQLNDADKEAYSRYLDGVDAYNDALEYYYEKLQDEQAQSNWAYKNKKKPSSAGGAGKSQVKEADKSTVTGANILTQSEFARRKAAGAESLLPYATYSDYYRAMKAKYNFS